MTENFKAFTSFDHIIAKIYNNESKEIVGSGFLISSHYLLTCAHVVIAALKTKPKQGTEIPQTEIPQAEIPKGVINLFLNRELTAEVIFWRPCSSSEIQKSRYGEDIAVLKIKENGGSDETFHNLLSIDIIKGKLINIMGFPRGSDIGVLTEYKVVGQVTSGCFQMEKTKQGNRNIIQGFSGAPVWDEDTNIIGMVMVSDLGREEDETPIAFAIASSTLIDTCLKFLELQDILLELDLKTVKKAYTECRQGDLDKPIPETIQEMIISFVDEAKFNENKNLDLNLFIEHLITSLNETKSNKYDLVIKWGKKYIKDFDESLNQKRVVKNIDDYMNGVVVYDDLQNPSSTDGYVEHFNAETQAKNLDTIETKCKKEIEKGNFIRIKGSSGMGKSELLKQLVNYCQSKNYLTIKIDFRAIEKSIFNDLKSFSTLFSNLVMREIITLNNLNEDQFIDYKTNFNPDSVHYSTTEYFKNQILTLINNQNKLILAMDNVDKLFTSEIIRDDICSLWRSWYDSDNLIRQKMVMIITHSTDDYPDYNINTSNLKGIGYVPVLTDWEQPQIKQICQQYQLNLTDLAIEQLISQIISKIGGHPYLVKLAINYLYEKQTTVENLLEIRLQEEFSPFCDYLDQILQHLQSLPAVCQIYAKILNSETITLKNINDKFHLKSMGLIKYNDGQILPKYPIYKDYFLPRIQEII
jgi:hypothetical protein